MIHLEKLAKPQILIDKEDEWKAVLMAKIQADIEPTATDKGRYRHPEVKATLIVETHSKCAYCESVLRHIHHGDVEHVYPKSLDPARSFEWGNLTLACEVCNQSKSDLDPLLEKILDPYNSEPQEHLLFVGPLAFSRGTVDGLCTLTLLDLNRGELTEQRKEHLEKVMGLVDTVMRNDIPMTTRKAIYVDILNRYAARSGVYSAMIRSTLLQVRQLLPPELAALPLAA